MARTLGIAAVIGWVIFKVIIGALDGVGVDADGTRVQAIERAEAGR